MLPELLVSVGVELPDHQVEEEPKLRFIVFNLDGQEDFHVGYPRHMTMSLVNGP